MTLGGIIRRAGVAALLLASPVAAQVATDGTLGARTSFDGDVALIGGDLGTKRGDTLFHSFERFSVRQGGRATFGLPRGTAQVISRVTGAETTSIDGLVSFADEAFRVPVAADFWFFNPNGVAIGPNASFRTSGALYLSASDSVRFADGTTFTADANARLTLTSAAPEAFGFLSRAGPLTLTGANLPAQGDGIALSGGSVVIDGAILRGENETITIVAGAPGGVAPITPDAPIVLTGGKIRILGGAESGVRTGSLETLNGGGVTLAGERVVIEGGRAVTVAANAAGGDVRIKAGRLILRDGAEVGSLTTGAAKAGNVSISAQDATLLRGGAIRSQTSGAGRAGNVSVTGFDRLTINRGFEDAETAIESEVSFGASGDAGRVLIRGGALSLRDGGSIFSNTFGDGDAGAVDMAVTTLVATGGSQIGGGARDNPDQDIRATGAGGSVTVTASESMTFFGQLRPRPGVEGERESSGLLSATEGRFTGRGGDLFASAPVIILRNEAEIGAETFFDARAGNLTLEGDRLSVSSGAEISTTARRSGRAGDVTLSFSDSIDVGPGGSLVSRALRSGGTAGRVLINTSGFTVGPGGRVATDSLSSDGGAIVVTTTDFALIDSGSVTTSVATSDGNGGSIDFRGGSLALAGTGRIESTALAGAGGTVTINAPVTFIEPPDATIDVSSALGEDGVLSITGVVGDETAEAEAPEAEFIDRFALIDDFCVAAVTGGSALRLVAPAPAPATASIAPALFGGAIPYPNAAGEALALDLSRPAGCEGLQ